MFIQNFNFIKHLSNGECLMKNTNDFNVSITCRHEEFTDDFKKSINNQLQKLSKFYSNIIKANVIIDRQNTSFRVEIILHVPGSVITATDEDYNHKKAIDSTIEKVERQIKKLKSKVVDHKALPLTAVVEVEESEEVDNFE